MQRFDPQQRPRLIAIIRNLGDRITEARMNGWLGQVEGLQVSLEAARAKLTSLDRARFAPTTSVTASASRSSGAAAGNLAQENDSKFNLRDTSDPTQSQ